MPANWTGFINDLSGYLTSKKEKTSQETADKIIDLYIEALSNKAQPLPGTSLFNSNDPKVISSKSALKQSFGKAMELLQKDPQQQKITFEAKKKNKEFVDPSTLDSTTTVPPSPPSGPIDPLPAVDEKYYEEIIKNSSYKFVIKQKDGNKSDRIFDYKTPVDFTLYNGYGVPLSLFGNTIPEVIRTVKNYGFLPGLLSLLEYSDPGYDLSPDINRRGVKTTYGELADYFVKLYAKGDRYRGIGDKYKSVTGATDETFGAVISSELSIIIRLYSEYELQEWLKISKPYIEKTAIDEAISQVKENQGINENSEIPGESDFLTKTIEEISQSLSTGGENDPYSIMANSLILFWTSIGTASSTLFLGAVGVPPSIIVTPNTYQIVFPGLSFIVSKGFRVAFNVGANPKFIPNIPFEAFQKNIESVNKQIENIGKQSAKATASAIAAVFASHLLTLKFLYFGQIPSTPSPIPAPAFVYSVY